MSKNSAKGKGGKKKGGKAAGSGPQIVTISTKGVSDAIGVLSGDFKKLQAVIAALPGSVQSHPTNQAALRTIARTLLQLKGIDLMVESGVCCDEQVQNCDIEIET